MYKFRLIEWITVSDGVEDSLTVNQLSATAAPADSLDAPPELHLAGVQIRNHVFGTGNRKVELLRGLVRDPVVVTNMTSIKVGVLLPQFT